VNRSALRWWLLGASLTVLAAGEWLRTPTTPWIVAVSLFAAWGILALRPWHGWARKALAALLFLVAATPVATG
jgi:hypothetical protein